MASPRKSAPKRNTSRPGARPSTRKKVVVSRPSRGYPRGIGSRKGLFFVLLIALVGGTLLYAAFAASTGSYSVSSETAAYKYTNDFRAQNKIAAVSPAACLRDRARSWSAHMASTDVEEHSTTLKSSVYSYCKLTDSKNPGIGEVIGWTSCMTDQCVADLMAGMANEQPPNDEHRQIMMNSYYTYSGVGVYYDTTHHKAWVTEDFLGCGVSGCVSTYLPAYTPIWHDWHDLNQSISGSPVVASWGAGYYDMFTCDAGTVYHKSYSGSTGWTGWYSLGGPCAGDNSIAATSRGAGSLDVYSMGADDHLHFRHYAGGTWGAWQTYSGTFHGSVAVTTRGGNTLDLYATKSNGSVWHMYYNGSNWGSGWESLGGSGLSDISAAYRGSNNLLIYARDASNKLRSNYYNTSGWHTWGTLGGDVSSLSGGVAADAPNASTILVAVNGFNQPVLDTYTSSSGYSGIQLYTAYPGQFTMTGSPSMVNWNGSHADMFVRGSNGHIWQRSWY